MKALEEMLVVGPDAPSGAPGFVSGICRAGREAFERAGLPTTRDEDWRFTSLASFQGHSFRVGDGGAPVDAAALSRVAGDAVGPRLVFVNGHFRAELSSAHGLPATLRASSLTHAIAATPAQVEPYLGRIGKLVGRPFASLNDAHLADGAFVHVTGDAGESPLELLFVTTAERGPGAAHPRVLVAVDPGGKAAVVETYVTLGGEPSFTNALTEIALADGAHLDHYQVQDHPPSAYHFATVSVRQDARSRLSTHSTALGAALSRSEVVARLGGEDAEIGVSGLYMADGKRVVDNHSVVEHVVPRATSRELFKGVLDGEARGVFAGRIRVLEGAAGSDARQVNSNLLLSRDAIVDSMPQLEIYTDDVKASHGGTVGELDRDAMFYLRSRGIAEARARTLLIYAFAQEMVERVAPAALRRRVARLVAGRLPDGGDILEAA